VLEWRLRGEGIHQDKECNRASTFDVRRDLVPSPLSALHDVSTAVAVHPIHRDDVGDSSYFVQSTVHLDAVTECGHPKPSSVLVFVLAC